MRGFSVSGGRLRLHHLNEGFGDELRGADTFDHHGSGEVFADRGRARGRHFGGDLFRARDKIGGRRQISDRRARRC